MEPRIVDPHEDPGWLRRARSVIAGGGVVAVPTETFYGLAVDPRDAGAVSRLLALKGYAPGRAQLLLAADQAQVEELAALRENGMAVLLARHFWPGPLTIILPLRRTLPAGPAGTVAIRVPDCIWPRELAAACGHPVTGTSANLAGQEPARNARAALLPSVHLVVDGGEAPGGEPSTLLDLTGDEPRLLRRGRVERAALEATLGRAVRP